MTHRASYYWTAFGGSTVATGMQLVVTAHAFAHKGHQHGQAAEADTPAPADAEGMAVPSADMPMQSPKAPIETTPVTQESPAASVAQANVTEGFSIGWGESLLGLIIAGPVLLWSLKKQLQS